MRLTHEFPVRGTADLPVWPGWLPLVLLLATAFLARNAVSPWLFMWIMAAALWAGCKWLVLWREIIAGGLADFYRTIAFLSLWPGMDAHGFLRETVPTRKTRWTAPLLKTTVGAVLFWLVVPLLSNDLAKGWVAMCGLILLLHFGAFHLLALAWQKFGIHAEPLMHSPTKATSLADFWSQRWNTAFNQLAFAYVFRPATRLAGSRFGLLAAFIASGLTHELVISIPARSGYGLPTLYFLAQGTGILFESSRFGKRLKLRRGLRGWLFVAFVMAAPAYVLFPPPFIRTVILPMVHVLTF